MQALSADLEKAENKGKLYPIKGDLRKEEDILSAFDWIDRNLGAVHVMVNNAGVVTCDTILGKQTLFTFIALKKSIFQTIVNIFSVFRKRI